MSIIETDQIATASSTTVFHDDPQTRSLEIGAMIASEREGE
jgi:hypothetical protein